MVETRVQLWQLLQHAAELQRRSDEIQRRVRAFLEEVARLSDRYGWGSGDHGSARRAISADAQLVTR
jgi:hypothetical protein